jgi:hypothetical protein
LPAKQKHSLTVKLQTSPEDYYLYTETIVDCRIKASCPTKEDQDEEPLHLDEKLKH